jgi:hypothetical protein
VSRCLPPGPGRNVNGVPVKIVQTPDPTWRGYSLGRWEGDALVVETSGFNDRVWLNITAHPHTQALRVTERYRRPVFGSLELPMTIDDPGAYMKPRTVTVSKQLLVDTELEEYVCDNDTAIAAARGN